MEQEISAKAPYRDTDIVLDAKAECWGGVPKIQIVTFPILESITSTKVFKT